MGIILVLVGIFAVIMTLAKPAFYWESRKAKRMRRLLGDTFTTLLYLVIGCSAVVVGLLELLGILTLS